jgi:hypothetical protein
MSAYLDIRAAAKCSISLGRVAYCDRVTANTRPCGSLPRWDECVQTPLTCPSSTTRARQQMGPRESAALCCHPRLSLRLPDRCHALNTTGLIFQFLLFNFPSLFRI